MAQWTESEATPISEDVREAKTLPTHVHVDEEVFEQEQSKIFADSWQYVGSKNNISQPGDYFTDTIAGRPLFVIRDDNNELQAYYNVCAHRGSRMLEGSGSVNRIMCPYHNWTYDKEGSFCSAPNSFSNAIRNPDLEDDEVSSPNDCENNLKSISVETLGPFVFVNLASDPLPFDEFIGSIPSELPLSEMGGLQLAKTRKKDLDCNWKVMGSNYLECDHCHSNHPDFVRSVDMDEYVVEVEDYYSVQHGPVKNDEGEKVGESRFYYLWPNTTINIYEAGTGLGIYRLKPDGPGKTQLIADYYFEDKELTDERTDIIETSFQLQHEDFELVERQQEGVESGAIVQGNLGPNEHAVHHFHRQIEDHLDLY